ncbi:rod shape-determining protein MreC [Oryzobacter telluris]|uniref:rod shape-determining protein MreC n=1 Tax=Oryzobacter telluris TaxID=3149179 RepID=UPI00370D1F25
MHVRRAPALRPVGSTTRRRTRRTRLLVVAVVLTALATLLGAGGVTDLAPVRSAAATVLGPLERWLGPDGDALTSERAARTAAEARAASAEREAAGRSELAALLADPALTGQRLVAARVVAVGPSGPAGPERVTIDVGSNDGVEVDTTVVAAEGLVGRVVSVAPWTSDVLVVGSPDLVVGVRVGERGVLGEASGSAVRGAASPMAGLLSLGLVERGVMAPGDTVTTLGSVGGRPYVAGVRVGTVREVDDRPGRLAPTGTLAPAVDPTSLDVVAVVLGPSRDVPRPVVTGTGS